MNSAAKLVAFAAAVAASLGGAMAVGAAVGPIDVRGDGSTHGASTLDTDLSVPGAVNNVELPYPASVATVDGYMVTLTGSPAVGEEALTFTVQRDGSTVRTDPYLGAAGHLVAIRTSDLAYLHVHADTSSTNPSVTFMSEFPTPGTYRLFFDFSHDGTVHTATYTVEIPEPSTGGTMMNHSEGH